MSVDRQLHREIMTSAVERAKAIHRFESTPEASRLYATYFEPLRDYMEGGISPARPCWQLVGVLGMDTIAAVTLQAVTKFPGTVLRSSMVTGLSRALKQETEVHVYAAKNPGRFAQLQQRINKENPSEEKAYQMFVRSARNLGTNLRTFCPGVYREMGEFCVRALVDLGILVQAHKTSGTGHKYEVYPSPEVTEILLASLDKVLEVSVRPAVMVCPPVPYGPFSKGGFLSDVLQDNAAGVLGWGQEPLFGPWQGDHPHLKAINALQATEWTVNTFILDTVLRLRGAGVLEEVVPTELESALEPFPESVKDIPYADRTEEQQALVREWAVRQRLEHGRRSTWMSRKIRMGLALREAVECRDEPTIWQAWAFDTRGRMYPSVTGMSSQGSDLQKALLQFKHGEPITSDALPFVKRNLAALYGFDKGTNDEMEQWVDQHLDHILISAYEPVSSGFWTKADSPLMFLAACREYAEYLQDPVGFRSHLPIALDGKANALQHLSAIMLDPTGAERTGLSRTERPIDIYQMAADGAADLILADSGAPAIVRDQALRGFDRSLGKRTTMTLGYGVRKVTVSDHVDDWLKSHPWHQTPEGKDGIECRNYLAAKVWDASNAVIGQAMEAFRWLEKAGKGIAKEQGRTVSWSTPDGFPAFQYAAQYEVFVTTAKLYKKFKFRTFTDTEEPNITKHGTKFAPNFIHSLDATHLRMVISRLHDAGCRNFAMIHDSFGCSVGYVVEMDRIIREEFVKLYTVNALETLHERHPSLPAVPRRGDFSLGSVLDAPYAFR